jgi:hypothetical protein
MASLPYEKDTRGVAPSWIMDAGGHLVTDQHNRPGSTWQTPPTDMFKATRPDTPARRHLHPVPPVLPSVPDASRAVDLGIYSAGPDVSTTPVPHPAAGPDASGPHAGRNATPVPPSVRPSVRPESDAEQTRPIPVVPPQRTDGRTDTLAPFQDGRTDASGFAPGPISGRTDGRTPPLENRTDGRTDAAHPLAGRQDGRTDGQTPRVVPGELVYRGDRLPAVRPSGPVRPRRSLSVMLGLAEDPWLSAAGMTGKRVPRASVRTGASRRETRRGGGLKMRYEHDHQALARREMRLRGQAHRERVDALRGTLAGLLRLEPRAVRVSVPLQYDDPSAATGYVRLKWGRTRPFDPAVDPADVPRLEPVRVQLPQGFPESARAGLLALITERLAGEWVPRWRMDVVPHLVELHRLPEPSSELEHRIRAICRVLGSMFGQEPWDVELSVPAEYANRRYGREVVADEEPEDPWSDDPDRPEDRPPTDGIEPVRLVLPAEFAEQAKGQVTSLLKARLGGEWAEKWNLNRHPMTAEFTRKLVSPRPPSTVDWELSKDKYSVFVGKTGKRSVYVRTETETPHWGVSAGTGGGKTTTLLLPAIHWRHFGGVTDLIDMKKDSFEAHISGLSGFRIHTTIDQAVAAVAEFLTSAMAKSAAIRRGFDETDIPPRTLIFDEFGSFVEIAKIWWRDVLEKKGDPPVKSWFHIILMQGRTKDHRVVVGTHDFSLATFGGTGPRDLLGTKILLGPVSNPKWVTTFGHDHRKVKHQAKVKGRGIIGITGMAPEEIQMAYPGAPEDVRAMLADLPPAPAWFDAGEMAPWITAADIASASREVNIRPFLPGGEFTEEVETLATQDSSGVHVLGERAGLGASTGLRLVVSEEDRREAAEARSVGFRQAVRDGHLPELVDEVEAVNADATEDKIIGLAVERLRNARKKDPSFPEPSGQKGSEMLYRIGDLKLWVIARQERKNSPSATGTDEA